MENEYVEELSQALPIGDPYPSKTPKDMLSRQYLIKTIHLNDSTLFSFNPYLLLKQIPTNIIYLSKFRYFRSGIKLKFLLVSNQMQYGLIAISFLPYTKEMNRWTSLQQRSQADMHLLDVSEQEAFEITLPYLSPRLFWDLQVPDDTISWRVDISALSLFSVSTTSNKDVYMKVFASFDEPEAAGYSSTAPALFQSGNRIGRSRLDYAAEGAAKLIGVAATAAAGGKKAASAAPAIYAGTKVAEKVIEYVKPAQKEKSSEPMKLEVANDLNAPSGGVNYAKLGDFTSGKFSFLPQINNIYDIRQICSVPTYSTAFLLADNTPHPIKCGPFIPYSYASFFKDMHKYWRGSTRILLKFATSPLVSGRAQVTLYPTGYDGSVQHDEGDLPSWVVTIKGPTEWALEVPYLSTRTWQDCTSNSYVEPVVVVTLLDTLPQPFDKPVNIFCAVFQGTGEDFKFAGLQSFVPPLKPAQTLHTNPVFQSAVADSIGLAQRIGKTYDFPFQGGVDNIHQVLTRFSSRTPAGSLPNFPFPIKIDNWASAYTLDNFDYVCNLYKFYTGETNVKMLYSGAVTTGALISSVGNSLPPSNQGSTARAGNSMVLTDQTVWPMLEFRYPFLNSQEFDSIWEPNGMYYQTIMNAGDLEMFLISSSSSFSPFYLLPVPDFFLQSKPVVEEPAIFQSGMSRSGRANFWGSTVVSTSGTQSNVPILPAFTWNSSFQVELEIVAYPTSAISNFSLRYGIFNTIPSLNITTSIGVQNAHCVGTMRYADTANNTNNYARAYESSANTTAINVAGFYLSFYDFNPSTATAFSYRVDWIVRISPALTLSTLSNPQYPADTKGWVGTTYDSVAAVPVTLTGSTVTPNVNVVNEVQVSPNGIFPVTVTGVVPVNVQNPVETVIDGVVAVYPTDREGNKTPFWTTLYNPYGDDPTDQTYTPL